MTGTLTQIEGKYEIVRKMREGGMGAIYLVRHRLLDQMRVIKVMRPHLSGNEDLKQRFLNEARTATRLRHRNIAELYDCAFDNDGNAFMVMEFISGFTIEEGVATSGHPPLTVALEIAIQCLDGIAHLHRSGVVHRDLSPDNVMISTDDFGDLLVKLIDLGIAKVLKGVKPLTATGMFLGKLAYASPEQFSTSTDVTVDARSDVYSFGIVLFELLTGHHPIGGKDPGSIIAHHLLKPPLSFDTADPEKKIPDDLRLAVYRALAKKPEERFESADGLRTALVTVQRRFPFEKRDLEEWTSNLKPATTRKLHVDDHDSTQQRLDVQFQKAPTTPPPPPSTSPPPAQKGKTRIYRRGPANRPDTPIPERKYRTGTRSSDSGTAITRSPALLPPAESRRTPAPPPMHETPVPDQTRRSSDTSDPGKQIQLLLAGARKFLELNCPDEAHLQLQGVLELDWDNEDALRLLEEIEETRRQGRESALAHAVYQITTRLKPERLDEAEELLSEAEATFGPDEDPLPTMRERVTQLRRAELDQKVQTVLSDAILALETGDLETAIARVEEAQSLDPESTRASSLRDEVIAAELRQNEERVRREAVEAAAEEARGLLEAGELPQARDLVNRAVADFGAVERLLVLRAQIDRVVSQRVTAALSTATTRRAAGDLSAALVALQGAEALDPALAPVIALRAEIEAELEREAVSRQCAEAAEKAAAEAADLLRQGELERALEVVAQARERLGSQPVLDRLERQALDERERRVDVEVDRLCQESRRAETDHHYDQAISALERARVLRPSNSQVRERLEAIREVQVQREEELARARAIIEAVDSIDELVDARQLDEAIAQLERAVEVLGEAEELTRLRRLIERERSAAEQRVANALTMLRDAREHLSVDDLAGASGLLREAERMAPNHPDVLALQRAIEEVRQRRRQQEQRAAEVAAVRRHFDTLCAADDLEAAEGCVERIRELGEDALEKELRERLSTLRQATLAKRVHSRVEAARTLREAEDLEGSRAALLEALAIDPSSTEAGDLLQTVDEGIERRARALAQAEAVVSGGSAGMTTDVGAGEPERSPLPTETRPPAPGGTAENDFDDEVTIPSDRVAQLCARARQLRAEGLLDEALGLARMAAEHEPTLGDAVDLREDLDRAVMRALPEATATQYGTIERLLKDGQLAEARDTVTRAIERFGGLPGFVDLQTRIEREIARRTEVSQLLTDVRELLRQGELESAETRMRAAKDLSPDSLEVRTLTVEVEACHARQREVRRTLDHAQAEIAELLERGEVLQASVLLQQAQMTVGECQELDEARSLVAEAIRRVHHSSVAETIAPPPQPPPPESSTPASSREPTVTTDRTMALDEALPRPARPAAEPIRLQLSLMEGPLLWRPHGLPTLVLPAFPDEPVDLTLPLTLRVSRLDEALAICLLDLLMARNRVVLPAVPVRILTSTHYEPPGVFTLSVATWVDGIATVEPRRALKARLSSELSSTVIRSLREVRRCFVTNSVPLLTVSSDAVTLRDAPSAVMVQPCRWAVDVDDPAATCLQPCRASTGSPLAEELTDVEQGHGIVGLHFHERVHLLGIDLQRTAEALNALRAG